MSKEQDKYFAFNWHDGENETFQTFEEAKDWLINQDFSEGIPEEFDGCCFIGKITHRTALNEIDNKDNYPCSKGDYHANCSDCEEYCGEGEEWPYNDDFDYVSEVILNEVQND